MNEMRSSISRGGDKPFKFSMTIRNSIFMKGCKQTKLSNMLSKLLHFTSSPSELFVDKKTRIRLEYNMFLSF